MRPKEKKRAGDGETTRMKKDKDVQLNYPAQGTLYVVATPIGNRGDLSVRAKNILLSVDIIFAEDTRSVRTLLGEEQTQAKVLRADANKEDRAATLIMTTLNGGMTAALITDAGTPAISDPGAKIISLIRERFPDAHIVAIPGPSALTAALSIAGIPSQPFTFFGFPPAKKGRKTFFETIAGLDHTAVFYESPHRFMKMLDELKGAAGEERIIFVGRELSKMHEEGIKGSISFIKTHYSENPTTVKGEFVIVVEGKK